MFALVNAGFLVGLFLDPGLWHYLQVEYVCENYSTYTVVCISSVKHKNQSIFVEFRSFEMTFLWDYRNKMSQYTNQKSCSCSLQIFDMSISHLLWKCLAPYVAKCCQKLLKFEILAVIVKVFYGMLYALQKKSVLAHPSVIKVMGLLDNCYVETRNELTFNEDYFSVALLFGCDQLFKLVQHVCMSILSNSCALCCGGIRTIWTNNAINSSTHM